MRSGLARETGSSLAAYAVHRAIGQQPGSGDGTFRRFRGLPISPGVKGSAILGRHPARSNVDYSARDKRVEIKKTIIEAWVRFQANADGNPRVSSFNSPFCGAPGA
tara:strand:+ start:23892 stop:24209 length:318 start_codon:yes stop_codon:yes gene_type:complete